MVDHGVKSEYSRNIDEQSYMFMLWAFVLDPSLALFNLSLPRNLAAKTDYNTSNINWKLRETTKKTAERIVSFLGLGLHPNKTAR